MITINFKTAIFLIIAVAVVSFTSAKYGFKYRDASPSKMYGGYVWNTDTTGSAGIELIVGMGALADTARVYIDKNKLHVAASNGVVFDDPGGFYIGEEQPYCAFSVNDSIVDNVQVCFINNNTGQSTTVGGNGTKLLLASNAGLDSKFFALSYDYDTAYVGANMVVGSGHLGVYVSGLPVMFIDSTGKVKIGGGTIAQVALEVEGTDAVKLPPGNTAQRPATPEQGHLRFNIDSLAFEFYDGTVWSALD